MLLDLTSLLIVTPKSPASADQFNEFDTLWGPSGPFFLSLQPCLLWPDQVGAYQPTWPTFLRRGQTQLAEQQLLTSLAKQPENPDLLAGLAYVQLQCKRNTAAMRVWERLRELNPGSLVVRSLAAQLGAGDAVYLDPFNESIDHNNSWALLLALASTHAALDTQDLNRFTRLNALLKPIASPEVSLIQARNARLCGQLDQAFVHLIPVLERVPHWLDPYVLALNIAMQGEMSNRVMPTLHAALKHHGEHPLILGFVTSANLLKRQPGLARRSSLLQRCWGTIQHVDNHKDNHLASIEGMGLTPWMEHIHPSLRCHADQPLDPSQLNLQSNLAMQLSSIGSQQVEQQLKVFLSSLRVSPQQQILASSSTPLPPPPNSHRPLTIGWLTSDFGHHPVGRFVLSFFEASAGCLRHNHVIISHRNRANDHFQNYLKGINNVRVVDVSSFSGPNRIAAIRKIKADLIVDLNGWTSGHLMPEMITRLAPVQVNYLGYHATTGVPEIGHWVGDEQLFPDPIQEWHSEQVCRLSRCFIAWQPSQHLPEAHVPTAPASSGAIRFGTFNHSRKFSDQTLRLWGQILRQAPNSHLVLKAHAAGDPATQALLLRRMHRAGLPSDRIIWLPLTGTTQEHLQQYSQIDVALDCTPNGGCTTTCEALWMGVPVITLAGRGYVSRMSTAVLHGAGLANWVAADESTYVSLALQQVDQLEQLRSQRSQWRHRLQQSPLGDAAGLMAALEEAFEGMVFKAA